MVSKQINDAKNFSKMYGVETEREDEETVMSEGSGTLMMDTTIQSRKDLLSDPHYESDHFQAERERGSLKDFAIENERLVAVADFEAQEPTDLSLKQGELVQIIATREDGWWLAKNEHGEQGFVPKTFLSIYKEPKKVEIGKVRQLYEPEQMQQQSTTAEVKPIVIGNENVEDLRKSSIIQMSGKKEVKTNKSELVEKNVIISPKSLSIREDNETKILEASIEGNEDFEPDEYQALPLQLLTDLNPLHDRENHNTYECYLAPRLSESNLAFHDIYWNYEDDRLRKRRVRVCKLIKIARLENVSLNGVDVHYRLIRAYLFDQNSSIDERQIVSNVYTIKAHPRKRNPKTWLFSTEKDAQKISLDYPSFIVRSNYKQKSVVLCLEAVIVYSDQCGNICDRSLGCVTMPIINESGHGCLQNKKYHMRLITRDSLDRKGSIPANTEILITVRVSNVPDSMVHHVDSLPDILLCNALFVPMFFYYRRLLGQLLTRNSDNTTSSALRPEPFLATFPAVADQPDLLELIWKLWQIHQKNGVNKKLSEAEEAEQYRSFFLTTGFILHHVVLLPEFSWTKVRCMADRQAIFDSFREQYCHNFDVIKYLSKQRCRPVNIFKCAVDIIGPHALS